MRVRFVSTVVAVVAALSVGSALAIGALAAPGGVHGKPITSHKPAPVTKINFQLDDHQVTAGTDVTGSVFVYTRSGNHWVPLEGASLSLQVDGIEASTLTTDSAGMAAVLYPTTAAGGHVMKVVYSGDDTHKRAQRAQGFHVSGAPSPSPSPTPTETTSP